MFTGISTACLYPMPLEDSLSTLLSMGFRTFEIFINTFSEMREDYLKELKKMTDAAGGGFCSLHPFTSGYENLLLFSEYKRRFEDTLDFYKGYFNACNLLGASVFVLHGRRSDRTTVSDEEFFERYLRLYRLGQEFGVTVAQENVYLFSSGSAAFLRRMRKACGDECAFVLDVKQSVRSGGDPFDFCEAMKGKIRQVHLNDNDVSSDCLLPGFGTMDYRKLFFCLRKNGYDGALTIEVYRKSFGEISELKKAKLNVDGILKDKIQPIALDENSI